MHQSRTGLILAGIAALLLLTSCGGGGGGGGGSTPANVAPTANAGTPQTVTGGATVTLNGTASSDSDGSIASYAWTQTTGTVVTLSSTSSAQPSFTAPSVVAATALTFRLVVTDNRGAASAGVTVAITVNPLVVAPVAVTGLVRFARVPFLGASPFALNYANATLRPSRGVIVRALNAGTQAVLATGVTDASGNYSLTVAGNTSITIQVLARMQRDASQPLPRWDVRVQDGALTSVAPYTFTSAAFDSSVGVQNVDIPTGISNTGTATGVRASGPFAVLDTIYTAMQTVIGAAPTINFPALIVDWGSQSSGTFFTSSTAQHIALLADLTEDTDEFDQHVIAHEFGHYLEYNFSRADNIGGSHSFGDRLDMRVAFGEGWGYAFAAIALNDTLALDSFVDSGGVQRAGGFNVETNPPLPSGVGAGCWCSESSVQSIIYDLYDSAPDGADNIALGFQPIWDVLTSTQRTTTSVTSIFSFVAALKTAQPASAGLIDALVAAQNINSAGIDAFATAEANTPFPGLLPLFPVITSGGPSVVVRSIDDGGFYNKAGNHAFLRFIPATTRNYTVSLSTSNANPTRDPDFVVYRLGTEVTYVGDDGESDSTQFPETATFNGIAGATYIIDAYDCANGCPADPPQTPIQGTQGDYNLTVTIN